MDPWTWLFGTLFIVAVTNILTFLATRAQAAKDREDRVTDEQRAARREAMVRYIHDTRDRLLSALELGEVMAGGDYTRGLQLHLAYRSGAQPEAFNELAADPDLVRVLTTTLPEIMERGWGKSKGAEWSERLADVGQHIRRAMREQELRVIDGHDPLVTTPEQQAALTAARGRVAAMLETKPRQIY